MNILFTSVGRRVELIHAFKNAVKDLDLDCRVIGTDIDPLAPALQFLDEFFIVPAHTDEQFIPDLQKISDRFKNTHIFPLIDPDILILSSHKYELEKHDARVVVIPDKYARITADKILTHKFLKKHQIPVPIRYDDLNTISTEDFPLFIKPISGSAAKNTFKIENFEALNYHYHRMDNPLIEEFLEGPEITNDVVCDYTGEVLGVVSRERIEIRSGEVSKGKTIFNKEITDYCIRIAKSLKAIGPITIQCIMKDNKPIFTEINARYGGGAPLGIAAGLDSPRWLLSKAAGIDIEIPQIGDYKKDLFLTRYDNSKFLTQTNYDKYKSSHI